MSPVRARLPTLYYACLAEMLHIPSSLLSGRWGELQNTRAYEAFLEQWAPLPFTPFTVISTGGVSLLIDHLQWRGTDLNPRFWYICLRGQFLSVRRVPAVTALESSQELWRSDRPRLFRIISSANGTELAKPETAGTKAPLKDFVAQQIRICTLELATSFQRN